MSVKLRKFEYQALSFQQRNSKDAPKFMLFHARAADILEWADVDRLEPNNKTGAQRPLRGLKVNKVAKYLDKDARNTIPTAVIVALDSDRVKFSGEDDKDGVGQHGKLTIIMDGLTKPGLIIDGQHRAYGVARHTGVTHLNIVAFLGGDDAERAFQFVVINNSATRVSRDHIRALNLSYNKEDLNKRLIDSAGVSLGLNDTKYDDFQQVNGSAPFKGLLAFPTNPNGFIAPNAIESGLFEMRDRAALLGIEDLEKEFFLAAWTWVKKLYPTAWTKGTADNPSHLLQKASIVALTTYILEGLEAAQRMADSPLDFTDEEVLETYLSKVVGRIPLAFWTAEWEDKQLDTSSGRQLLLDSLKTIDANLRFGRPWWDKVSLIDPAQLPNPKAKKEKKAAKKSKKKA